MGWEQTAAHHHGQPTGAPNRPQSLRFGPWFLPAARFPPDHATGPYHHDGNPPTPPAVAYPTLTLLAPRAVACANLKPGLRFLVSQHTFQAQKQQKQNDQTAAGPGGLDPDAGIGLPFRDCRLPHVNEKRKRGQGDRKRLSLRARSQRLGADQPQDSALVPRLSTFFLLSAQQVSFAAASLEISRQSPATKLSGS